MGKRVLARQFRKAMSDKLKGRWERHQQLMNGREPGQGLIGFALAAIGVTAFFAVGLSWLSREVVQHRSVTVYTSQDIIYASGILSQFEAETGVRARVLYDSEAVKTVGLANRLLAEQAHPRCDVFWNNEVLRTRQLALRGVYRETNGWAAFGYRSRRLVINTNLVAADQAPRSLLELTNRVWRGKVALAYPMFGTTATHFLALRQHWGATGWRAWCQGLRDNESLLLDGNSLVVQMVGHGEAWVGMTDSDDVAVGLREGLPVAAVPLSEEMMLIPNSVGVVRGGPDPEAAEQFFQFLQRRDVVDQLVTWQALEGASADELTQRTLEPDWNRLLADLERASSELQSVFLR
jgi:iron(III) transport system substrate-binding protein